eukprot:TRINITY_DN10203_c0_g1_i4.p1 TRINITY_DN10203_c0_g1~~TRINITY_DN10203_c0_g1_i4.p1  ORF type:complete len:257 (-),score=13.39 TRINITY_DN10203_c0_g1_i4:143-913(-)
MQTTPITFFTAGLLLLLLAAVTAAASVSSSSGAGVTAVGQPCYYHKDCTAAGQYCQYPSGQCRGSSAAAGGTCASRPQFCTQEIDYVCGCNGRTYPNPCAAAKAKVSVASAGRCPVACNSNGDCGKKQYCAKSAGSCGSQGQCQAVPEVCPAYYQQVCGCDGKEYGNPCYANGARTNVARTGPCSTACTSQSDCSEIENSFCQFPAGQCGGSGSCVTRVEFCAEIYLPVCGCDGRTYGNSCTASSNGVSIRSQGEC